MDFTSLTGQLLSAGITRTLPPAPVSACELTSSSVGTIESSVSGFQPRVRSRSPGKICHREPSSSSTMWLSEWDRILMARFASAGSMASSDRLLLPGLLLATQPAEWQPLVPDQRHGLRSWQFEPRDSDLHEKISREIDGADVST